MNEFEAKEYILNKGKDIKTKEELFDLIKEVEENFNYDYGVAPRSIGATAAVVANYLSYTMGITGFQAGCAMWDFITSYTYKYNKCGLKMIDYDNMLYPQYDDRFEKTISKSTFTRLQEQAKKNLEEDNEYTAYSVIQHWRSIVDGVVPFGYRVVED